MKRTCPGKWRPLFLAAFLLLSIHGLAQEDTLEVQAPVEMTDEEPAEDEPAYFREAGEPVPVQPRRLPSGDVQRVRKDEAYWYANAEQPRKPEEKSQQSRKTSGGSSFGNTLFWILIIGGFFALLAWFLASSNIRLFRSSRRILDTPEAGEALPENIFELAYTQEINGAVASQNYRLAVRLQFLQVLKMLSERNLIKYTPERTNADYLAQLAKSRHYRDFFRLTRNFEYVWYGEFPLSAEGYRLLEGVFAQFKQGLG